MKNRTFRNIIINTLTAVLALLLFAGCDGAMEKPISSKEYEKGYLCINVGKTDYISELARTVLPSTQISEFTDFVLTMERSDGLKNTYKFEDYESLTSSTIGIETGDWRFVLTSGDFSCTVDQTISAGQNSLSFNLDYVGTSNMGSVEVTLSLPADERIKLVKCALLNVSSEKEVQGYEAEELELVETETQPAALKALYSKQNVPAGYYIIKWNVYGDSEGKVLLESQKDLLLVQSGLTSAEAASIQSFRNIYDITYNLGGGSFVENFEVFLAFTDLSDFDLPKENCVVKEGHFFEGWYTTEDFSGERLGFVKTGTSDNLTLYAKWKDEEVSCVNRSSSSTSLEDYNLISLAPSETLEQTWYFMPGYTYRGVWVDYNIAGVRTLFGSNYNSIDAKIKVLAENGDELVGVDDDETFSFTVEQEGYYTVEVTSASETQGYCAFLLYSEEITYTIQYVLNGGSLSDSSAARSYSPVQDTYLPDNFYVTRAECIFTGWYETEECNTEPVKRIPAGSCGNKVFYAGWEGRIFQIEYELNGGTNAEENPSCYTVLDSVSLADPSRTYYDFLGWYTDSSFGGSRVYEIEAGKKGDVTLYAKWKLTAYPVNYELNGGNNSTANPSSYTVETESVTLATPSRTGCDFGGWFATEDFSGDAVETIAGGLTGAVTLYAKWNIITYSVTYELNGGTCTVENPALYTIESDTITLAEPQKEGFTFGGWYTSSSLSGTKQTSIEKGSTGNKVYYAKWLEKCTVSYTSAYGTAPAAIIVGEGEKLTAVQLPELTSSDYFFSGWYVGETLVTAGNYTVTDNVTLTAKWSDKCNVSYVTAHGTAPQSFDVGSGTTLTTANLPALKESGWKFLGWYANSSYDKDKKARAGQCVTTSITLYAKWEEYTGPDDGFVFVEGGTVVGSSDYNHHSTGAFPSGRTVTLSSFYISDHELTQGEYETYSCYTSYTPSSSIGVGADYPAYYVSWYDAIVYCNLKSMAEGLTPCYALSGETDPKKWTGIKSSNGKYSCSYTSSNSTWNSVTCNMTANGYRLPTDAEWEYAARGGQETYGTAAFANYFAGATTTNYYGAESNSDLDSVGWYQYNVCNNGVTGSAASSGKTGYGTHKIKTKAPNALGLYDMSGNVREWCWDWNASISSSETVTDPCGASSGSDRLLRGGSWYDYAYRCSVSYRFNSYPYSPVQLLRFPACSLRSVTPI